MSRNTLVFAVFLLGTLASVHAATSVSGSQSKQRANPLRLGAVSGRVLAITKGGDLKPGRFAHVYLFFVSKILGHKVDPSAANDETAGLVFLDRHAEQTERLTCKSELLAVDRAILATLEWSQQKPHLGQAHITDADEEGNFVFTGLASGKYYIVARGRAGANDAFWKQDVWIQPGEAVTIKVAEIESSCADSD